MRRILLLFGLTLHLSLAAQEWKPKEWPVLKHYDNQHLYRIALPLGGIGTGTVSLGGRGELRDWEIMNVPAKNYSTVTTGNNAPFFAIYTKEQDQQAQTTLLSGPLYPAEYLHYEGRGVNHHGMPRFAEVMTGFEYCAAVGMLYEGMVDEALKCIESIRKRHDGAKRNPFSEPECGHHYARSMASWGAILAWSDFRYSGIEQTIHFTDKPGNYFWSNGYAWGSCTIEKKRATLDVIYGEIPLKTISVGDRSYQIQNSTLKKGDTMTISMR